VTPGLTTKPRSDSPWLSLICAFFLAMVLLDFTCGEGRKPRSDLAWLCLFFALICYGIAWFHAWRRAKTSLRPRLTLLDFCYWGMGWARTKPCLELASLFLFLQLWHSALYSLSLSMVSDYLS
jgi:hypothetical protein